MLILENIWMTRDYFYFLIFKKMVCSRIFPIVHPVKCIIFIDWTDGIFWTLIQDHHLLQYNKNIYLKLCEFIINHNLTCIKLFTSKFLIHVQKICFSQFFLFVCLLLFCFPSCLDFHSRAQKTFYFIFLGTVVQMAWSLN